MHATTIDYVGNELELFEDARNWKRYLYERLSTFIRGDVAEVGAGMGATTEALVGGPDIASWLCIEPDFELATGLARKLHDLSATVPIRSVAGTLQDQPSEASFDTIIYIDVLEHIEDDRAEVSQAALRLRPGGNLVVLCPAFPFLYSEFDAAIGHYRRYTKSTLSAVGTGGLKKKAAFYMDAAGALASLSNKLVLGQRIPSRKQIRIWDRVLVPISQLIDRVMPYFGKSVVLVWGKP